MVDCCKLEKNGLSLRHFHRLTMEYIEEAGKLCDRCVGKNLYTRDYLKEILDNPEHFFYLLMAENGEIAGYIYFYMTGIDTMSALSKLSVHALSVVSKKKFPILANISSIGVSENYKGHLLSYDMVRFCLEELKKAGKADAALAVCWKIGDFVPMEKTFQAFSFQYLSDSQNVWYDKEALVCPYCEGRCTCSAAVYYKILEGGGSSI